MSEKVENNISKALDMEFIPVKKQEVEVVIQHEQEKKDHVDTDYDLVRKNLKNIIKQSEAAIEGILDVASESESPRAYEVVSQLIHSSLDANSKLLEIHKKMKDLKKDDESKVTSVTNNSIYVGSTAELQKFLLERRKQQQLEHKDADKEN